MNTEHLDALRLRLSHERIHFSRAQTDKEKALRRVWIAQMEKEIEGECKFLGIENNLPEMSDDDLLSALTESDAARDKPDSLRP